MDTNEQSGFGQQEYFASEKVRLAFSELERHIASKIEFCGAIALDSGDQTFEYILNVSITDLIKLKNLLTSTQPAMVSSDLDSIKSGVQISVEILSVDSATLPKTVD